MAEYQRMSAAEYNKLRFQLQGQYVAILNVFNCYGMNNDVLTAVDECVKVAENFGMAVRGKGNQIHILHEKKRRAIG